MIRRGERADRYTVIPNVTLEDRTLSFKALGLLVYLLSKPDHWRVDREQLAVTHADGVTSVRSALRELAAAGYLVTEPARDRQGRLAGKEAVVYDRPHRPADNPPVADRLAEIAPLEASTERASTDHSVEATAGAAAGQLPGLVDPQAGDEAGDDETAERESMAWQLVRQCWAAREHKPIESRKTTQKVVVRLLAAGWSVGQIDQALRSVPAWTSTSIQVELSRGNRRPANRVRPTADRNGESGVVDVGRARRGR